MSIRQEIVYKLIVRTPIPIGSAFVVDHMRGILRISASSLKGITRQQLRTNKSEPDAFGLAERVLFGSIEDNVAYASSVLFTDAECRKYEDLLQHSVVRIDPVHGTTVEGSLESLLSVPAGTEFIGRVIFNEKPNGIQRCMALSALLDIERLGRFHSRGFGKVDVQIMERSSKTIFISYSWEDSSHMEWVHNLAIQLINHGIDVILDQLSPAFDVTAPQDEINAWMTQCLNNCDNILVVLTPNYRHKSVNGVGGVGFEFKQLLSEQGLVSEKLSRYVGVLKKGSLSDSLPGVLTNCPVIDMRSTLDNDGALTSLIEVLTIS